VRTDDLIRLLANGTEAVDAHLPLRRLLIAALAGTALATLLTAEWLGLRSTFFRDFSASRFWIKEVFCVALSVGGLIAVARLGRPGARIAAVGAAIAVPVVVIWLLATWTLLAADAGDRASLILGQTANVCSVRIALLSIPLFVAILAAMRGLAPTRLWLAGAAAGLAAGSIGALAYSLHCPEIETPFLAVWYVLGILIPTSVGALAGPPILRW
jgi:hypothetical protein